LRLATGKQSLLLLDLILKLENWKIFINIEDELTPLQAKLEIIASRIGLFGVVVAVLTFLALVIRGVVEDV